MRHGIGEGVIGNESYASVICILYTRRSVVPTQESPRVYKQCQPYLRIICYRERKKLYLFQLLNVYRRKRLFDVRATT